MKNIIDKKCDFCQSDELEHIYSVPTSRKSAEIYNCLNCGLVQTFYESKNPILKQKSLSADADWGNIRHGKKARLDISIEVLNKQINLNTVKKVLDIGSNRGHFVNYIISNTESTIVDAIEPDSSILSEYIKSDRLTLHNLRFELFQTKNKYDLIYCCHTLEHADSASDMLRKIVSLLSDDGILYIDIPNIKMLSDKLNIQEFFIDKHKFHFNSLVLIKFLTYLGLEATDCSIEDRNIILCCTKKYKYFANNILSYINTIQSNRDKLYKASRIIEELASNHNVAIYGASQNLNALIKYGNLELNKINYIIDDHLYGYIDSIQNKNILSIDMIKDTNIDYVILLTKSSTELIIEKIKNNSNISVKYFMSIADLIGS